MLKKFSLLAVALAAIAFAPCATAQDAPPGPAASAPVPAAPVPAAETLPQPVARKEEDEQAGMLARLRTAAAALTNTGGVSGKVAALEKEITARDKTIAQLTADLKERTDLLASFDAWLTEQGHTTAKTAAADPGKAFAEAVGTGVAAAVQKIGVPAATITVKQPTSETVSDEALTALVAEMHAEKDPQKKGQLVHQVRSLRAQIDKKSLN